MSFINSSEHSPEIFVTNSSSDGMNIRNIRALVDTIFYVGFGTLECLLGIPTNIINCLVFWRQGLRDRVNLCLFCLALADCSYFTIMFVVFPVAAIIRFYNIAFYEEYLTRVTTSLPGVLRGFALSSGCINMVVAVDTCVCVVFPHRAASIMRTKTIALLILCGFLLIQASYCILPFSYKATQITTDKQLHWAAIASNFYEENQLFVYILQSITLETVLPLIILTVVSVTTGVTVTTLRSAMAWREKTSYVTRSFQSRQVALTKMLTIVAIVFIIVMAPGAVFQVIVGFYLRFFADPHILDQLMIVITVIYVFSQVNSCLNFFIYYYRSTRFSQELLTIFSRPAHTKTETSETSSQSRTKTGINRVHQVYTV